jgi:CheY-like chemotaxis protein
MFRHLKNLIARAGQAGDGGRLADAPRQPPSGNGNSPRLLVVDDLPANFLIIERMLQNLGWRATMVLSGSDALKAMEAQPFDAVLTDCRMPGINGFELARAIRAREAGLTRRTVIIGVSANDTQQDVAECLASGMDDFLAKPLSADSIRRVLEKWLQNLPASGA